MKLAVIGATGLVGRKMIQVLGERSFPCGELVLAASSKSVGTELVIDDQKVPVIDTESALSASPDIALFSAGSGVSLEWAPRFAEAGTFVIDNSSAWRMEPGVPLVVPEVNGGSLDSTSRIIANPNCSTIQMVVALAPLHRRWRIKRLVISTYQSITGTGKYAVAQYDAERLGQEVRRVYPHQIFQNCLPHCDVFQENNYTREEMKLVNETRKILGDQEIGITATAVRVPVVGGHGEAVNVEFTQPYDLDEAREMLQSAPGVVVADDPASNTYPMPIEAHDKDAVFVGRLRRDYSTPNAMNLWIVADNLRKGAATNAVQIGELLLEKKLVASSAKVL